MSNLNLFEMKKLNFFFFLSLFALTGYLVPGIAQENTAINIPGKSGSNYFQFRFSDSALGTHSVGDATVDSRTKTFTMSAWVKASTAKGDIMGHLQDNRYQNSGSFSVRLMDGKLGLYARGYYPNGGDKFATAVNSSSSTSLEIGVWTFISVVSDDANKTLTLYKDGVQIQKETVDAEGGLGLLPDACIMFVGGKSSSDEVSLEEIFAGDLDEVQLWNKALTSEEIKTSMGGVDPSSAEGLLAHYTFVDNVNNEYQNQGSVENLPAKLVSGPKRSGSQSWEGQYYDTFSTVASTLVEGHIKEKFKVTYSGTVEGGTFVVKNDGVVVESGSDVDEGTWLTVDVTPEDGYLLKSIKVNGVVIEKGQGFILADNSEVVVEFSDKLLYSYIGTVGGNIAATINDEPLTDQEEFDRGSEVKLTVIPDDHYELISLMIGSEERKDDVKDNILVLSDLNENLTVSATFSLKRFAVTFQSIGDGTLTIEHDDVSISSGEMFEYGTVLTGVLSYEDPIVISSLTKNGISILDDVIGNKFSFTVDDITEIKAVFKGAAYTVDYQTDLVGGKLVVTNDADGMEIAPNTELPKNTEITIKPVAEKYYEVTEFRINGRDCLSELQDNGGEYWITLAENVTVSIVFAYPDGVENISLSDVYYNHKTSVLYVSPEAIVNVYNITGSLVFKGVGTQNLGKLPIGNYIAKVKTDKGVRTIKFIKK